MSGVGTQFLAIISGILLMALLGMFNVHRHGSINAAAILLYAFTSCELFHSFTALSLAYLLTPRTRSANCMCRGLIPSVFLHVD